MASEALRSDLVRYVREYGWNWGIVRELINKRHGTDYAAEQLKALYGKCK